MRMLDKLKRSKFEINPFGKIANEDIVEIEEMFDILLPDDYKKFLLHYNGGAVVNNECNELRLEDINEIINIDVLYGIHTGNSSSDIEYWTNEYREDLLEKTVIIGDSLQQGFIVLICDGFNNGVYYYDDSYCFDSSNDESNVYLISNTFDEFWKTMNKK